MSEILAGWLFSAYGESHHVEVAVRKEKLKPKKLANEPSSKAAACI